MALLGRGDIARAALIDRTEVGRFALRPMVLIIGAVVAFALLLDPAGLAIASLALVVLARLGGYEFRIREVLISYVLMTAAAWLVFVYWLAIADPPAALTNWRAPLTVRSVPLPACVPARRADGRPLPSACRSTRRRPPWRAR